MPIDLSSLKAECRSIGEQYNELEAQRDELDRRMNETLGRLNICQDDTGVGQTSDSDPTEPPATTEP